MQDKDEFNLKFYKPKTKFNHSGIPEELRQLHHWITWSLVTTNDSQKKPQKRIVYTKTTFGKKTTHLASKSIVNPRQSFFSALAQYNSNNDIAGLGILLPDNNQLQDNESSVVCVDFDNILPYEQLGVSDKRPQYLDLLSISAFTEVSQSGNGTHTFMIGKIPSAFTTNPGVEIYQTDRFIAMTGANYDNSPDTISPANSQQLIDGLISEFYPNGNKKSSNKSSGNSNYYEEPDSVGEGNRNNAITRHCGYLMRKYGPGENTLARLIAFNTQKCSPPLTMDELSTIFESIKSKHQDRFSSIVNNICHLGELDLWYELDTMTPMTASSLNTRHAKTRFTLPDAKGDERPVPLSKWLPYQEEFIKAQCLTWEPSPYGTTTPIIEKDNLSMLNLWNGFAIDPKQGDVTPWLELVAHLIPETDYRSALLWWIAFTIQRPDEKCQWHPIITGAYGAGKDALFKPLAQILGDSYSMMGNKDIKSDYDDALYRAKLVHISEPNNIKRDAIDFYKRIAASEASETMLLNIKGGKKVRQKSLANVLAITNNLDAFKFEATERRALVLKAPIEMSDELNKSYFNWYDNNGTPALFDYLLNYDLSTYSKNKLPYRTNHFIDMVGLTQSDIEMSILEAVEGYDVMLPDLLTSAIGVKEYDAIRKAKLILAKNGWVRWDNNEKGKRIRKKFNGIYKTKGRGWYVRQTGEFFDAKPPAMYMECERIEDIFTKKTKY